MKKHSLLSYVIVFAVFFLLWSSGIGLIYNRACISSDEAVKIYASTILSQQSETVDKEAGLILERVFAQNKYGFNDENSLLKVLDYISTRSDYIFYLSDSRGSLYDIRGNVDKSLDAGILSNIDNGGYALSYLADWKAMGDCIAYTMRMPSNIGSYEYIVCVYPIEYMVKSIEDELNDENGVVLLFNEWGNVIFESERNTLNKAKIESIIGSSDEYVNDRAGNDLQRNSSQGTYNIYMPLNQPNGWFVGIQISQIEKFPHISGMMFAIKAVYAVGLVLFSGFLALSYNLPGDDSKRGKWEKNMDYLTGLMIPSDLEEAMVEFSNRAVLKNYSLIALDISSFRRFNLVFGDDMGDKLLSAVGGFIKKNYFCGTRVNGDVFLFIVRSSMDITHDVAKTTKGLAEFINDEIMEYLRQEIGSSPIRLISLKLGVYPLLDDTFSFREVYDNALLVLKTAKNTPKRIAVIYDRNIREMSKRNKDIETNMLKAIQNDEFEMYIQPKFYAENSLCCGGEALVRWRSEEMGFLTPNYFIPLFEQNGFIVDLDLYMLKKVLIAVRKAEVTGQLMMPISLNQSRITISFPGYMERLKEIIEKYPAPLDMVEIEITESAFTDNHDMVIELVDEYHKMGFTVAMDDFGTGYSSLNTLRELPVDVLKIDKGFLNDSDTTHKGRKIIENIINMSKDLGIETVCEGVETGVQMDYLKSFGCDIVQGYLMSKPIPYGEYERKYAAIKKEAINI